MLTAFHGFSTPNHHSWEDTFEIILTGDAYHNRPL